MTIRENVKDPGGTVRRTARVKTCFQLIHTVFDTSLEKLFISSHRRSWICIFSNRLQMYRSPGVSGSSPRGVTYGSRSFSTDRERKPSARLEPPRRKKILGFRSNSSKTLVCTTSRVQYQYSTFLSLRGVRGIGSLLIKGAFLLTTHVQGCFCCNRRLKRFYFSLTFPNTVRRKQTDAVPRTVIW